MRRRGVAARLGFVILIFVSACGLEIFHPTSKTLRASIADGEAAMQAGRYAFAAGKFKKAYSLDPEHRELPLQIARAYASIASQDVDAKLAARDAVFWLWRAKLVSPTKLDVKMLGQPPFASLGREGDYQMLIATLQEPGHETGTIERVRLGLERIEATAVELGRIIDEIVRVVNWFGLGNICLFFWILVWSLILRLFLNWRRGMGLWFVSFVIAATFYHYLARIFSGGVDRGWDGILKVGGAGTLILIILRLTQKIEEKLVGSVREKTQKNA